MSFQRIETAYARMLVATQNLEEYFHRGNHDARLQMLTAELLAANKIFLAEMDAFIESRRGTAPISTQVRNNRQRAA